MSLVGKTKDAGWEIGVSRTVHRPLEEVWDVLTSPAGVRLWLGSGVRFPAEKGDEFETREGTTGQVRSYNPLDRIRLTWQPVDWSHDSTVQVALSTTKSGTRINFHQERLASAEERERQREHWAAVLDQLCGRL